jgi:hypothetical protein
MLSCADVLNDFACKSKLCSCSLKAEVRCDSIEPLIIILHQQASMLSFLSDQCWLNFAYSRSAFPLMASAQSSKKRNSDDSGFLPLPKLVKAMEYEETMPIAEPSGWVDPSEVLDCVEGIDVPKFEWVFNNCVVFDWMVPDWMEEKQIETEVYEWAQSQPEENLICIST